MAAAVPATRCWFCFNYFDEESRVTLQKQQTLTGSGMFFLGHHESLKCSSATCPLPGPLQPSFLTGSMTSFSQKKKTGNIKHS